MVHFIHKTAHLSAAVMDSTYARALSAIDGGIKEAANRIERASKSKPEDYAEFILDLQCELIENLLGAQFVVCQTKINSVSGATLSIYEELAKKSTKKYPTKVHQIHATGENIGELSCITGIVALANYFKHSSEWSFNNWKDPKGKSKHTIIEIKKLGLRPFSSGNLRTGAVSYTHLTLPTTPYV